MQISFMQQYIEMIPCWYKHIFITEAILCCVLFPKACSLLIDGLSSFLPSVFGQYGQIPAGISIQIQSTTEDGKHLSIFRNICW